MARKTIRGRSTAVLALGAALMSAVICALVLIISYQVTERQVVSDAARSGSQVSHLVQAGQFNYSTPPEKGDSYQVVRNGVVVASSADLRGRAPMAAFSPTGPSGHMAQDVNGYHVTAFHAQAAGGEGSTIYVKSQIVPWYVAWWLPLELALISLAFTTTVGVGAWWLIGRTLRPVEGIRAEMEEISVSDLGRRVSVPDQGEELVRLAQTANLALARIERGADQQRRFTSDASHDLRSPLTAMRIELESALADPGHTDWPLTAKHAVGSVERIQAIIEDLLELARLDAGVEGHVRPVPLAALVGNELDRYPRRVEVRTDLDPAVTVDGDQIRLARVLTNLLDNAERHTRSMIEVTVRADGADAVLEVADDGDGVPEAERETVFQRFTRLDAARCRDAGGTGLGLAIAREIATAHGGSIRLADSERGARFELRLPRRA